ncbi:MAG: lipoyl synthase [Treponema sp.]|jgi:lipoic acid synthetase|nr:lipoyl synthase [Treponema sp.]
MDMQTKAKPAWLKKKHIVDPNQDFVERILKDLSLNTVCREAMCPNYMECFARKTATFLILGKNCTRNCAFCNLTHNDPLPADPEEPVRVGKAAAGLGLRYVVVTSVTRDDMSDGGAGQFAATVREIRKACPGAAVETLIPDFQGKGPALAAVADSGPDVISHNIETVKYLYSQVRPQADYRRSLGVIKSIGRLDLRIRAKSGIMVGLGESREQVLELFGDLRTAGCSILTIGQYLAPSKKHYPVKEFVKPEVFDEYKQIAAGMGFEYVASSPFVRSSYHAGEALGL